MGPQGGPAATTTAATAATKAWTQLVRRCDCLKLSHLFCCTGVKIAAMSDTRLLFIKKQKQRTYEVIDCFLLVFY